MEYEDFFKMINDILNYVGNYPGRVIVCEDNPKELIIGFTLMDVDPFLLNRPSWYIKLRNFRDSLNKDGVSPRAREVIREMFQTERGRLSFAEFLTNGRRPPGLEEVTS